MCKILGASKSSYYDYVNEKTYLSSEEKLLLLSEVKDIFYFHKKKVWFLEDSRGNERERLRNRFISNKVIDERTGLKSDPAEAICT